MNQAQLKTEEEQLKKTYVIIKSEKQKLKKRANKYKKSMDNQYKGDYLGKEDWKHYRRLYLKYSEKSNNLEFSYEKPYFARMDFRNDSENENLSYYVGKKELVLDGEYLIYDWRSTLGNRYYVKNQKEFKRKDMVDKLTLRRAFDISNRKLIKYVDEYNLLDQFIDGDVIDPFLIDVLQQKKIEKRTTDIISTIQKKQHEIIRYSKDYNLIVQGCAGSGKTMILLHRLSYWLYNDENFKKDSVMIISPSNAFIKQSETLNKSLEIDEIENLTITDFFTNTVEDFFDYSVSNQNFISDSQLASQFLNIAYSREFINFIEKFYSQWFEEFYNSVDIKTVKNLLSRFDITHSGFTTNIDGVNELKSRTSSIEIKNKELKNKKNKIVPKINSLEKRISEAQKRIEPIEEKLEIKFKEIINRSEFKELFKDGIENYQRRNNTKFQEIQDLLKYNLEKINTRIKDVNKVKNKYNNDLEAIKNLEEEIISLQEELETLNLLQFIKKITISSKLKVKNRKLNLLEKHLMRDIKNKFGTYSIMIEKLESLEEDKYEVQNKYNHFLSEFESYKIIQEKYSKELEKKLQLDNEINILKKEYSKIEKTLMSEREENIIKNIRKIIPDTKSFGLKLGKSATKAFEEKHNYTIEGEKKYTLIAILWISSLFNHRRKINYQYFYIDEGQDLNLIEYELIQKLTKSKCVMNIFGDYRQNIHEDTGLKNWKKISKKNSSKIFKLEENYRNPIEVTLLCNQLLGTKNIPFGYENRDACIQISLSDLERDIKENSLELNQVLIVKSDKEKESISELERSIDIMTVTEVKGMEFNIVYVYSKNMIKREKYVAYTRALKELKIIDG